MTFRWLVRLSAWLDKRFPPKLVVTAENYEHLNERVYRFGRALETLDGKVSSVKDLQSIVDRIEDIEKRQAEITKMLASPKKTESEIAREQFIRGEFPTPFTRRQVEAAK